MTLLLSVHAGHVPPFPDVVTGLDCEALEHETPERATDCCEWCVCVCVCVRVYVQYLLSPCALVSSPLFLLLLQNNIGLPLCSFNTYADYVYDVKWSPKHPAVFASVDGSGRLQLWNLNNDYEVRMGSWC